jgi:hypothetical protein
MSQHPQSPEKALKKLIVAGKDNSKQPTDQGTSNVYLKLQELIENAKNGLESYISVKIAFNRFI